MCYRASDRRDGRATGGQTPVGRARINLLSINRLLPASDRQAHLGWLAMTGRRWLARAFLRFDRPAGLPSSPARAGQRLRASQRQENQSGNIMFLTRNLK